MYLFIIYYALYYPFQKIRAPYLRRTTAAARALPSHTSACWVFSCFRNPPNTDMEYNAVFNVRT